MSATGSMGFHEPVAENTVILRPQSTIPHPTVVQALAALTAKIGCVSRRLEELLSSCQSDGEIDRLLWDDLEVLRRSADRYMNQYLDDLEQVHKQQVRHVYEVDNFDDDPPTDITVRAPDAHAANFTRVEWRLKISHDSLTRDLLAIRETLELLMTRGDPSPNRPVLPNSLCMIPGATIGCMLWQGSYRKEAIGVFAAHGAAAGYYYLGLKVWEWLRSKCIGRCQGNIEDLYQHLNQGKVDEKNRQDLNSRTIRIAYYFRT